MGSYKELITEINNDQFNGVEIILQAAGSTSIKNKGIDVIQYKAVIKKTDDPVKLLFERMYHCGDTESEKSNGSIEERFCYELVSYFFKKGLL